MDGTQYAGFGTRLKAFGFDYLLIAAYILLLFGVTLTILRMMNALGRPVSLPGNPLLGDLTAFVTLVLPVILYFSLQESSSRQSTWGKRKWGLLVVNGKGERLTFGLAFIRSFLKFLPWQIA
ncbi:MAG: RDD family protein, partial [Chloroflexota bacterium]